MPLGDLNSILFPPWDNHETTGLFTKGVMVLQSVKVVKAGLA